MSLPLVWLFAAVVQVCDTKQPKSTIRRSIIVFVFFDFRIRVIFTTLAHSNTKWRAFRWYWGSIWPLTSHHKHFVWLIVMSHAFSAFVVAFPSSCEVFSAAGTKSTIRKLIIIFEWFQFPYSFFRIAFVQLPDHSDQLRYVGPVQRCLRRGCSCFDWMLATFTPT